MQEPDAHESRLYSEGLAAYSKGLHAEAEKLFAQEVLNNPGHAHAWHARGVCCTGMARLDEAETSIRKALEIKKDAMFYSSLGFALVSAQKADDAIAAYRASLALNPGNAQACSNLGNLLKNRREWDEAEALYRRAIALAPDYTFALFNFGALLCDRGNHDEAEKLLRRGFALNPAFPNLAPTLGRLLVETGRVAEAVTLFKTARAWGTLAGALRTQAAWSDLAETDAACISDLQQGRGNTASPWSLLNLPDLTPALQRKAALGFANARHGDALHRRPLAGPAARAGLCTGPLRIGYLSADYFGHATMHLMAGVLEAHDPARVEVHLLSINARPADGRDAYAKRIAAMPAAFHDLSSVSDMEAAERIARIGLHLLIDLKGYTTDARTNITAMRPAPVIVNWLGYPGTLGHERLADYIIGDPVVTPPGHAGDFSETLALMPHCYQPNDRSRPLDAPPGRGEEGLPESGFVFCSFNQFIKFHPATFDIWCRLLAATPGSVLWLLGRDEKAQSNLKREAQTRGIADERLIFARRESPAKHAARLRLADLALDTFPCNSHTTASDALWAGVPLVTRIGTTFASRVAASVLTAHGFPELIALDDEAYFDIAMSLIRQPEKLRRLRQRLDAARFASPLFDTGRFARDLERLYEAMWQQQSLPRDRRGPIVLA
jgi:predicted O-linked N-acetylglucosamine transferase (SPINDLY family)